MPPSPVVLDSVAEDYLFQRDVILREQEKLEKLRQQLIAHVEAHGHTPARAIKSKALSGNRFVLRVSYPSEVTVDTAMAAQICSTLRNRRLNNLFACLFNTVTTFTLAGGAHHAIKAPLPKNAPRNLRSLFGRAIQVRECAPHLEIRERSVDGKSGKEVAA